MRVCVVSVNERSRRRRRRPENPCALGLSARSDPRGPGRSPANSWLVCVFRESKSVSVRPAADVRRSASQSCAVMVFFLNRILLYYYILLLRVSSQFRLGCSAKCFLPPTRHNIIISMTFSD